MLHLRCCQSASLVCILPLKVLLVTPVCSMKWTATRNCIRSGSTVWPCVYHTYWPDYIIHHKHKLTVISNSKKDLVVLTITFCSLRDFISLLIIFIYFFDLRYNPSGFQSRILSSLWYIIIQKWNHYTKTFYYMQDHYLQFE